MSLLLDALKRSEHERQQALKDRLSHAGPAPGAARTGLPWAAIIAVMLSINILLLVVWLTTAGGHADSAAVATPIEQPPHRVRSLAREAALAEPPPPPAAVEQPISAAPRADAPAKVPATTAPVAAPPAPTAVAAAPALDTLPAAARDALPELHLDVHVYTADPAGRFVIINMQRYRDGDVLADGPRVERITPDGVVLSYRGQSFLLPRH